MTTISIISGFIVILLEAYLVYVQRLHLTYTSKELVVFPLLLMGVSLLVTILFLIRVIWAHFDPESLESSKFNRIFLVSYLDIRETFREKTYIIIAIITTIVYALLFSLAQGLLIKPSFGPYFEIINEGPPGYAPIFMFFPMNGLGFIISAYQLMVVCCLSLLTGINIAVFSRVYNQRRALKKQGSIKLGLVGASTGLLIACPTCVTPPIMIFLSTILLPLTSTLGTSLLGEMINITVLFFISLILLIIGLGSASRTLHTGHICNIEPYTTH